MAISNLETTIEDIEQLINVVRPDSKGKIMLPKGELKQLLDELRKSIPNEIKKFTEKTKQFEQSKSRMMEEARINAERIMNEARVMKEKLLDENEQIKIAEERANQIIEKANEVANNIVLGAESKVKQIQDNALKEYDDSLIYMLNFIQSVGQETTNMLNNNIAMLKEKLNDVMLKRQSLNESIQRRKDIEMQKNMMANANNNQMQNGMNQNPNNIGKDWC